MIIQDLQIEDVERVNPSIFQHGHLDGFFESPHDAPPGWLLMLFAYLDETGHETKDHVFIAGYLGTEDQWKALAEEWSKALGPQRKKLHMHELKWKKHGTEELLARLGPIPEKCGLEKMLGGARVSDYEDMVTGTVAAKLIKGYIAALFPLVIQALKAIPKDERLELVFEEQREYQPVADKVLSTIAELSKTDDQLMTSDGKPKLAKWGYVPKESTILLQPAEYLAYATLQLFRDQNSKKTNWCLPLLGGKHVKAIGKVMKRHEMRAIISATSVLMALDRATKT